MAERKRYPNYAVLRAVQSSKSMAEVIRRLGGDPCSGGTRSLFKARIRDLGLSTEHFERQERKGGNSRDHKLPPELVLNFDPALLQRKRRYQLKRALLEIGRPYKCEGCPNDGHWNGKKLVLEIDHKDRNWRDNRQENLRFLCPNCHSQLGL